MGYTAFKLRNGSKQKGVVMRHEESALQKSCVRWFAYQFPKYHKLLFAIPNGGARRKSEAAIMKAEGVRAGVADMILLIPRRGYGSLCCEAKIKGSYQSKEQKEWQKEAEDGGNCYFVFRTIEEFIAKVYWYLDHAPKSKEAEFEELIAKK